MEVQTAQGLRSPKRSNTRLAAPRALSAGVLWGLGYLLRISSVATTMSADRRYDVLSVDLTSTMMHSHPIFAPSTPTENSIHRDVIDRKSVV